MKISRDYIGKNVRLRVRYGSIVEGLLEKIHMGTLTIRQNIGVYEWRLGGILAIMEGQVVAIEEIKEEPVDDSSE